MWESLEPQGCESHSPPLPPAEMSTSDSKVKKKKCVCVCVCIYIYIYIYTTQERITCIYFNSDCTFDFVSGLYHIPKIVGKLLFTFRTVFIWEEIQLVWVGNNRRKLKYIFWKDDYWIICLVVTTEKKKLTQRESWERIDTRKWVTALERSLCSFS